MKKSFFLFAAIVFSGLRAQSPTYLMGTYWTGSVENSAHYNTSTHWVTTLNTLSGVTSLAQGVTTYDPVNKIYYNYTDLGNPTQVITKIDAQTGALLGTITTAHFIKNFEYNSNTGNLVGTYWTGSQEIYCTLDPSTGALNSIATLSSTSFAQGESTFDQANNRYFIKSNLGIEMIDASSGVVLDIFNPQGLKGIEYNSNTGQLIGSYWNGSQEIFASMDLSTGNIAIVGVLSGVAYLAQGETAFDAAGNRYFNKTNLGITTIDAATGSVISSATSNLKGFEYIGTSPQCALSASLTSAPTMFALRGNNVTINVASQQGATYQWQSNPGNFGWMNVPANSTYSGANTPALTVNNINLSNHRQPFRVIVSKNNCVDTSNVSVIHIMDTCVVENNGDTLVLKLHPGTAGNTTQVRLYPNPTSDYLMIDISNPGSLEGYSIQLLNTLGSAIYHERVTSAQMRIDLRGLTESGVYLIRVLDREEKTIESKRIIVR